MRSEEMIGPAMGSRSLLRRMNSLGILRQISGGSRSMAQLVAASRLSRTAVDAVVSDLLALGWAEAHEVSSGRLGRPAATYGLARGLGVTAAVDIGANHVQAVIADLGGGPVARARIEVRDDDPADARLDSAEQLIRSLLQSASVDDERLWAIGVGSPGTIDDGVVRYFGGEGMPGWVGLDLGARFASTFGSAVIVEGDVALGAEAELSVGAAVGRRDVVYVLCGVRTSGALVVNGRVHRGVHGAAGIVGELPQLRWAELESTWSSGVPGDIRPSRELVFARAREGDSAAIAAADEFADALATGTAALVLALDPELIVIGGGSSPSADVFFPRFRETLARLCPVVPEVVASTLGSEAVALGAISLAEKSLRTVLSGSVTVDDSFPTPDRARALLRAASTRAAESGAA